MVSEGKVTCFSKKICEADKVYDAEGKIAIPGGIDPHVHFRDPSSNPAENFETGTLAAAHGGVTTIADMPNTEPPVTDAKILRDKLKKVRNKAHIDFMLLGGVGKTTVENIKEMAEAGVGAVKTFMISRFPGLSAPDTSSLKEIMLEIKKYQVPLMVHAEDEGAIVKLKKESRNKFSDYAKERIMCESIGVARVLEIARQTRCPVHIVHLSSSDSMDIISMYRKLWPKITVETTPHYLTLTMDEMDKQGPYAKVGPPLRNKFDNRRLVEELTKGNINFVASDHAPYPKEMKDKGYKEITLAPSGMPGIETTLPVLFTLYSNREITLETLIKVFSTNAAKFLGIYPKKGCLLPGSDADIVLIDPKSEFKMTEEYLLTKTKQSMFLGKKFKGEIQATFCRGELIIEKGTPLSKPGRGTFLKRFP